MKVPALVILVQGPWHTPQTCWRKLASAAFGWSTYPGSQRRNDTATKLQRISVTSRIMPSLCQVAVCWWYFCPTSYRLPRRFQCSRCNCAWQCRHTRPPAKRCHHSWQNSAAALVLMIRWWMVMAPHQFDDAKLLLSKLVTKSSTPRPAPSLRKELPVVAEFLHLLE